MSMFSTKPLQTSGYHVSPQFSVKELEKFLNLLPNNSQVINIAHQGSAGQQVIVVYKN